MIVLPAAIRDDLVRRARAGAPAEDCGVLAGSFGDAESRVAEHYPTANAAERPRERYRIAAPTLLEALERIDGNGLEAVGFWHSHPRGPSTPSETDRERAAWPDRSYAIVSLAPAPTVRSWRWRASDAAFERERVAIE